MEEGVQGEALLIQRDPPQHLVALQPFDEQHEKEYGGVEDEE